jgi:hypothetical protein
MQQIFPKRWYPFIKLHGVTYQKKQSLGPAVRIKFLEASHKPFRGRDQGRVSVNTEKKLMIPSEKRDFLGS